MNLASPIADTLSRPRPAAPGLALYSVRRSLGADAEACLGRVAEMGFRCVCGRGGARAWAEHFRSLLDANGLSAPVVILEPAPSPQEQFMAAAILGARFATIPASPVFFERRSDGSFEWRRSVFSEAFAGFVSQLPALAAGAAAANVRLLYHFHDLDFVPMDDGLSPFDWLSTRTDPAQLGFHLDTAWLMQARADLPGLLQRLKGRVHVADLKDLRVGAPGAPRGSNMLPAGEGEIAFASMAAVLAAAGVEEFFIENEPLPDEWAGVGSAVTHLRRLGIFASAS